MLTIQSRIVLHNLKKLCNDKQELLFFYKSPTCFTLASNIDAFYNYEKYKDEIDGIIKQLLKDDRLELINNCYRLTSEGIHPIQATISFIMHNVLTPVVVSFITTLVTLWLQSLL